MVALGQIYTVLHQQAHDFELISIHVVRGLVGHASGASGWQLGLIRHVLAIAAFRRSPVNQRTHPFCRCWVEKAGVICFSQPETRSGHELEVFIRVGWHEFLNNDIRLISLSSNKDIICNGQSILVERREDRN